MQSVPPELIEQALARRPAALGRLLSIVEAGETGARAVAQAVLPASGTAYTVGVTGAPGAGKSTLANRWISTLRASGARVAVLAIDPTSPLSGGALLGDRVRMLEHAGDDGVFIRSMATRGHIGGLATAAPEAVRVLDAAGYDWILLETVGVGQVSLDVAGVVDTTVVVVNPGWGDDVQAAKAGILEIADVFAINKADRPGAEETRRHLEEIVSIRGADARGWSPPVVETAAAQGRGLDELQGAVEAHRAWLTDRDLLDAARAERLWREVEIVLALRLAERAKALAGADGLAELRARVAARALDPWAAAELLTAERAGG